MPKEGVDGRVEKRRERYKDRKKTLRMAEEESKQG